MKELTVTICSILYTNEQINKVRKYVENTFGETLEMKLTDICVGFIDKSLEQIREFEKVEKVLDK